MRAAVAVYFNEHGRDPVTCVSALLCITELTSNVVRHAYPDGQSGEFEVLVRSNGDHVELRVTDQGVGFPREPSSGIGLQVVQTLCDEFSVNRADGSTRVTARLELTA